MTDHHGLQNQAERYNEKRHSPQLAILVFGSDVKMALFVLWPFCFLYQLDQNEQKHEAMKNICF